MPVKIFDPEFERLDAETLARWAAIPASTVSDVLGPGPEQIIAGANRITPGAPFAGQAVTVSVPPGDVLAAIYAISRAWPGSVLVIAAYGCADSAVTGELLGHAAQQAGMVALVTDGPLRDIATLRAMQDFPVYCNGFTPAGPWDMANGTVNGEIRCGGVRIRPGDLIVGDDDGVAVAPLSELSGLYERCRDYVGKEDAIEVRLKAGENILEVFGLAPITPES